MVSKIELEAVMTGEKRSFDVAHAERILRMGRLGGYAIPKGSEFTFDERNGIRLRGNKKNSRKSAKEGDPE